MDRGAWWAAVHGVATERLPFHFSLSCIGEGNGSPLQCSCMENPLVGCHLWGRTELDTAEATQQQQQQGTRTSLAQTVKASAYNARYRGLIPGSGRSPGEGNGNPL